MGAGVQHPQVLLVISSNQFNATDESTTSPPLLMFHDENHFITKKSVKDTHAAPAWLWKRWESPACGGGLSWQPSTNSVRRTTPRNGVVSEEILVMFTPD